MSIDSYRKDADENTKDRYRECATRMVTDELSVDSDAKVSLSSGGAWVQVWVWVSDHEAETGA